jgi:type IV pilus assembly protein PilC
MAYPIAMFTFSMLITMVLIIFIVPVFVNMFSSMGGDLPLPTQVLVTVSDFIRGTWFILLPGIFGAFFLFGKYKKTKKGRHAVDAIKLKLPIMGMLTKKMSVSRFTRTLGTLMASGVPILQALDIVADSSGNAIVSDAVKAARSSIKEGETISKPLVGSKVFPPMVVQMISVGEETGSLDAMLSKISDFYDMEVAAMVDALTSIIEPLMIVVMGLIIGGIIVSLYMPMFEVINLMK